MGKSLIQKLLLRLLAWKSLESSGSLTLLISFESDIFCLLSILLCKKKIKEETVPTHVILVFSYHLVVIIRHNQHSLLSLKGLLLVEIHWGEPLLTDTKVLAINSLLFYSRPVGHYHGQRRDSNYRVHKDQNLYTICYCHIWQQMF